MKTEQKSDVQKIEDALNDYVTHWNNNDMDSWGTLFTDDVDYINRKGGWWKSNKENIVGHKHIHKMLIDMGQPKTFSLEIQKIEFLKPDVAVVQVLSEWPGFKPYDPGGIIENIKGIITGVFVKTEGEWLIKTLHNTLRDSIVVPKIDEGSKENVGQGIKEALLTADESGDWSGFLNMMDDNVTFRATISEGTPISGVFKGKTKVIEYFDSILPSVASFSQNTPMEFVITQNRVIVLGDDTYTILKNEKLQRSPYAMIVDHKDGKISNILIIQDLSGIYQAYTLDL